MSVVFVGAFIFSIPRCYISIGVNKTNGTLVLREQLENNKSNNLMIISHWKSGTDGCCFFKIFLESIPQIK